MVELKKMCALIAKNLHNLDTHWIIEISLILHSIYLVPRNKDKVVCYVNNYIDWD